MKNMENHKYTVGLVAIPVYGVKTILGYIKKYFLYRCLSELDIYIPLNYVCPLAYVYIHLNYVYQLTYIGQEWHS